MKKNKPFIFQCKPLFGTEERKALNEYMLSNSWLTEFEKTKNFEEMVAKYTNTKHCIATNNGTISLTVAGIAAGIESGDEVLIPNYTMIGTPNSIKLIGAKPVFVDVEESSLCIDLKLAKKKINSRTKAMFLVSPNGRYPERKISEYESFCKKNNIILIEDAAQSLGSFYPDGRHLGSVGLAGTFSLTPHKIISTGQGGMIITNNSKIAKSIRKIKDFGRLTGGLDIHNTIGYNFKFTDLQSVIGIEQLNKIDERVRIKKNIYLQYYKDLKDLKKISFFYHDFNYTSPLFVDCLVSNKSKLKKYLYLKGIETRDMYPPINKQKAYNEKEIYPVSDRVGKNGIWLPSSLDLTIKDIKFICQSIKNFYHK